MLDLGSTRPCSHHQPAKSDNRKGCGYVHMRVCACACACVCVCACVRVAKETHRCTHLLNQLWWGAVENTPHSPQQRRDGLVVKDDNHAEEHRRNQQQSAHDTSTCAHTRSHILAPTLFLEGQSWGNTADQSTLCFACRETADQAECGH